MSGSEKPDLSGALAVGRKLDLILPDSRAVRDACDQAEVEDAIFGEDVVDGRAPPLRVVFTEDIVKVARQ